MGNKEEKKTLSLFQFRFFSLPLVHVVVLKVMFADTGWDEAEADISTAVERPFLVLAFSKPDNWHSLLDEDGGYIFEIAILEVKTEVWVRVYNDSF